MPRLDPFVDARSIAVVGASERNVLARITLGNLRRWGFPGRVVGVHPSGRAVEGFDVVPSLDHAGSPDLALLAIGAPRLADTLRQAAAAGVRSAVIPGAGANEGGARVEDRLRAAVQETGLGVIGPNCMGFAALHDRVIAYVGTLDADLQRGRVGLVSQSGSVCELFTGLPWRVGFSHVISVGNELDVDLTDALDHLVADGRTGVIGLFVEGVRRPDAFRHALRRAAEAAKPVVVLKVGRSALSRSGTVAHTGVLAGDARVFSSVLRDAGAIEVRDLDEMLAALELLGKGLRRPPGRVVYAGDSGGQANLFADLAADAGVDLPQLRPETLDALRDRFPSLDPNAGNPLDLWALDEPEAVYRDGLPILLRHEPHLVVLGLDKFLSRTEPERAFVREGVRAVDDPGATVLMAYAGSDSADEEVLGAAWRRGMPVVRGASATLRALGGISAWAAWRGEAVERSELAPIAEVAQIAERTAEWSEHAAKRLLSAAGVPVTAEEEASSVEEAIAAAGRIGFPVVAKLAGPAVVHKTEAGGVRLGLRTRGEVAAAAEDLLRRAPRVLLAEQRTADLEVIVGAFLDEQFGPCAVIGLGGLWTEALQESVVVAGPGSQASVRRALRTTRWGSLLLDGARGRRFAADRLVECCLRLLDVLAACRDRLATVEINPLFVSADDIVAVDALVEPYPRSGNRSRAS